MGHFKYYPEGASIQVFKALYTISYEGGDGNDVVLTQASDPLHVDSELDTTDFLYYPGGVTLREAIIHANSTGGGEITFATSLRGKTIELQDGEMIIDSDVNIVGLGADQITIDGQNSSRIFTTDIGNHVEISGLKLTGGNSPGNFGGAIRNFGTLTLSNMLVTESTASLGGGVESSGPQLTLINSTLSNNHATTQGGGLSTQSNVLIVNSTISGNTASIQGGGLLSFGTMTVVNSTVTGNRVSTGTGGGIFTNNDRVSTATLFNTIVAGNYVGESTPNDIGGTLELVSANNIIGDSSSAGGITVGTNSNIVGNNGVGVLDINLILDTTLSDGVMPVHELVIGSPAIHSGSNELAVDQNNDPLRTDNRGEGFERIVGSRVDIGAVEFVQRKDVAGWNSVTGYWSFAEVVDGELTQATGPRWSATAGWDLHSADFTGDGVVDYAGRTDGGSWYVIDGVTKTSEYWGRWGSDASQKWNDSAVTGFVDVGDFNGDGKADIIGKNWRGEFYVAESSGSGFSTSYYGRIAQTGWVAHRTGDFNGDHITDVISFRDTGDRWVSESTGSALTLDHYGRLSSQAVAAWQNFLVGDFNDDGIDDILQQAANANGQWWMGTSNGLENGAFTTSFVNRWNPTAFEEYHIGDFDGDGKDDLLGKTSTNQLWVNRSNGGGQMALQFWGQWSASADFSTLIGDFTETAEQTSLV